MNPNSPGNSFTRSPNRSPSRNCWFSDAAGTPGQRQHDDDLGTGESMIQHNLNTIVEALK
jgi:hypothetical protein